MELIRPGKIWRRKLWAHILNYLALSSSLTSLPADAFPCWSVTDALIFVQSTKTTKPTGKVREKREIAKRRWRIVKMHKWTRKKNPLVSDLGKFSVEFASNSARHGAIFGCIHKFFGGNEGSITRRTLEPPTVCALERNLLVLITPRV